MTKLQPPLGIRVVIRAHAADPARRKRLVRLLAVLLDKPDTPDENRRP